MKLIYALGMLIALGAAYLRAELQTNIEYGEAAGQKLLLDAYVPEGKGPFPAVILVHGGGWTAGDKSGGPQKGYMVPMHAALEKAGFAWFEINYRLAPKHPYPACIEDVDTAIKWVKAHTAEYHLDPKRIALSGESSGGYIIDQVVMQADESMRMAAVVSFYGRCDLVGTVKRGDDLPASIAALIGSKTMDELTEKSLRAASPLFHVHGGLPPFLLVHGTVDQSIPYDLSVKFEAALREAGNACELITIKDGVHGMIYWDKVAPDYRERVVAWLQKTMGPGAMKED